MRDLDDLEIEKWLDLNSKLQKKKNALRRQLKEKGILEKGALNDYDHYKYFSEAQYKKLFTELFSENMLELKHNEIAYDMFEGSQKQNNGRLVKIEFTLIDVETGFYETTIVTGEGLDKGDKAGYKADTGALKYYLANTFMVATGDDPEKDSLENKNEGKSQNQKNETTGKTGLLIEPKMEEALRDMISTKKLSTDVVLSILNKYGYSKLSEIKMADLVKIRNELAKE